MRWPTGPAGRCYRTIHYTDGLRLLCPDQEEALPGVTCPSHPDAPTVVVHDATTWLSGNRGVSEVRGVREAERLRRRVAKAVAKAAAIKRGLCTDGGLDLVDADRVRRAQANPRTTDIVEAYLGGKSCTQIAAMCGLSVRQVERLIAATQTPFRGRVPVTPLADDCTCSGAPSLYNAGHRCARTRATRRDREAAYRYGRKVS